MGKHRHPPGPGGDAAWGDALPHGTTGRYGERIDEPNDAARGTAGDGRPVRTLRRTRWVVVVVTLVVGLAASGIAWRQANRDAEAREVALTRSVTEAARATAANAIAGLGGASALVDDSGHIDPVAFSAFQRDVDADSSLEALGYVPTVTAAERPVFEAAIRRPILEVDGTLVHAAEDRPSYWPIQLISPPAAPSGLGALIGFDIADNPLTDEPAHRARDENRTTVTQTLGPIQGTSFFFILKPLYRLGAPIDTVEQRRAAHVGFVASAYSGAQLSRAMGRELPEDVRYEVRDGTTVVAATTPKPTGGDTRTFDLGGRDLAVRVQDVRPVSHDLSWFLLGITGVIVGALLILMRRSDRFERETARTTTLIGRTAELAQFLAGAATADQVASVIGLHVPPIFGAQGASFGEVDRDAGVVRIQHGPNVDPELASRYGTVDLADHAPVSTTVRTGSPTLVRGATDWAREADPVLAKEFQDAGVRASAVLPLESDDGEVVATVGISWDRPQRFDGITEATFRTVAELCEQSLERAAFTDRVAARASDLAKLAELLAGAATIDDAARTITGHGRQPVGASAASIGVIDESAGVLRVHHGDTVGPDMLRLYSNPPLDAPLAFTDAARTGEVVLVPDYETYVERYPDTDPSNAELGRGGRAALPLRADDRIIGSIVFAWAAPVDFDDALVFSLTTVAEMTAQTLQRARLTESQAADARHSRDLARLAQGLASRAHTEDITAFLTKSVLDPLDATHAIVGVVDGEVLRRSFSSGLSRLGGPDADEEHATTPLDDRTPLTDAARTGIGVFLGTGAELRRAYPELDEAWDLMGCQAMAATTVRDRTGRVVGSLGVMWDRPVRFDDDLRDRLTTVTGIVGQSMERARLSDELRDSAARNELLADFAQHLAQVRTVDELCDAVLEHAGLPAGAARANIALVDDVHRRLDVRPRRLFDSPADVGEDDRGGVTTGVSERLDDALPATDATRTREPVLLASPAEIAERYPGEVADAAERSGLAATAHLPLLRPDGSTMGAIGFGWSEPTQFTPTVRATLRTLAELCSQTLERTRLGEAEHRLVESLQHRVVTPLPTAAGISIAQRYLPAARQVGMGGDWYEGIAVDDHRYALVVGDIAGHGIAAVADMIQLRSIIGSLLRSGTPLGEVFARVASLLQQGRAGLTATSCVAVVDTAADEVRFVSAGHLPPVLRGPDGSVRLLEGGRQPLLGVPSTVVEPGRAPCAPGSGLVPNTDGISARRHAACDDSIARLTAAVAAAGTLPPERFADDVITRCLDGRAPEDDVALVVVARETAPQAPGRRDRDDLAGRAPSTPA